MKLSKSSSVILSLIPLQEQKFIEEIVNKFRFTFSETEQLIVIERDLTMWKKPLLSKIYREPETKNNIPQIKKQIIVQFREYYMNLQNEGPSYNSKYQKSSAKDSKWVELHDSRNILGECPVSSEKTRCCNLKTLDAIQSCGFDCSYCSIQSFYNNGELSYHKNLKSKLKSLNLDKSIKVHIGTGQSSDSLMWGNRDGLLEDITDFARDNPQVALELKTKSDNISWLVKNHNIVPDNVLVTWTINTQSVIENEERLTAPLNKRIDSARAIADVGIKIGFHFHPMIIYKNWKEDYGSLFSEIIERFSEGQVTTISFGTLTFTKPVIKKIRQREFKSSILQLPLEEIAGKYSYPLETKKDMFRFAYSCFSKWHSKTFFYLCMEDITLWKHVFGFEYKDNKDFENAMLNHYLK